MSLLVGRVLLAGCAALTAPDVLLAAPVEPLLRAALSVALHPLPAAAVFRTALGPLAVLLRSAAVNLSLLSLRLPTPGPLPPRLLAVLLRLLRTLLLTASPLAVLSLAVLLLALSTLSLALLVPLPGTLLVAPLPAPLLVLPEAILVGRPIGLPPALLAGVRSRRLAAAPSVLLDGFVHITRPPLTVMLSALALPVASLSVVQLAPPVLSVVVLTHGSRSSVARRSMLPATVAIQRNQRPHGSKCCHRCPRSSLECPGYDT